MLYPPARGPEAGRKRLLRCCCINSIVEMRSSHSRPFPKRSDAYGKVVTQRQAYVRGIAWAENAHSTADPRRSELRSVGQRGQLRNRPSAKVAAYASIRRLFRRWESPSSRLWRRDQYLPMWFSAGRRQVGARILGSVPSRF